jgi:hypothetical protein
LDQGQSNEGINGPTGLAFKYHGNYCGPGWNKGRWQNSQLPRSDDPLPISYLDSLCKQHDEGYAIAQRDGLTTIPVDLQLAKSAAFQDPVMAATMLGQAGVKLGYRLVEGWQPMPEELVEGTLKYPSLVKSNRDLINAALELELRGGKVDWEQLSKSFDKTYQISGQLLEMLEERSQVPLLRGQRDLVFEVPSKSTGTYLLTNDGGNVYGRITRIDGGSRGVHYYLIVSKKSASLYDLSSVGVPHVMDVAGGKQMATYDLGLSNRRDYSSQTYAYDIESVSHTYYDYNTKQNQSESATFDQLSQAIFQ